MECISASGKSRLKQELIIKSLLCKSAARAHKVVTLRSGLRSRINSTVRAEKGVVNLVNQEKDREKVICPKCNSDEVAHILYGYPTPEARKEAKEGKYYLGGCELGSFFWHCRNCKHEW